MGGVRGHAEADNLGEGAGAAGEGGVEGFEDEHGGAFTEDQAGALEREGAAGVFGDDAHGLPGLEAAEEEGGLGAAGDGHGRLAGADHPEGLADGVGGGRAGGGDGVGRALDAVLHADVAGTGVGHGERDGEGMDAVAAVVKELPVAGLFGAAAAEAGAGNDGGVFLELGGEIEAGGGHGFAGGNDGELGEAVHEADVFGGEEGFGVVVVDLGRVFEADVGDVNAADLGDGGATGDEGLPEGVCSEAEGADDADAGDGDAMHG